MSPERRSSGRAAGGGGRRRRSIPTPIESPAFIQVSVWATVLRTMYLYEEADALGRPISWGFPAPQLLVIPRAGWLENAFYERRSHSLQFFSFKADGRTIHTEH